MNDKIAWAVIVCATLLCFWLIETNCGAKKPTLAAPPPEPPRIDRPHFPPLTLPYQGAKTISVSLSPAVKRTLDGQPVTSLLMRENMVATWTVSNVRGVLVVTEIKAETVKPMELVR